MSTVLAPALRPYVVDLVPYDYVPSTPGAHVGLPSTSITFVIPIGAPIDVEWASAPRTRRSLSACVSGLHTAPATIWQEGHQRGVQLAVTPGGCRALFGVPAAALSAELLELAEVVPALARLPEELADAPTWSDRIALVQRRLLAHLARLDAPPMRAEVGRALAALTGRIPVSQVAADVGYSRRRLADLVRSECGLTPQQFQRLARFERSADLVRTAAGSQRVGLAAVAAASGYADQAHLTREWREFTGLTPTGWLREQFPFVQDAGWVDR